MPEFSVRMGGATSIDVTKPGIDKAYGVRKLRDILGISLKEMIVMGDAMFPGGNDYPAEEAGVIAVPVRSPEDTKRVIEAIIACLEVDVAPDAFVGEHALHAGAPSSANRLTSSFTGLAPSWSRNQAILKRSKVC